MLQWAGRCSRQIHSSLTFSIYRAAIRAFSQRGPMADLTAEEIAQLEQIVATLRRRLGVLELQRARLGEHSPPHIVLEIEDIKRELVLRWANLRRLRPDP